MDRVADIVLIIVGVLLLILLVLGLAISCRPLAAEDPAAATATALAGSATPGGPGTFFTPTPTSFFLPTPIIASPTPGGEATLIPGFGSSPTPGGTAIPGEGVIPGAGTPVTTAIPGGTGTGSGTGSGSGLTPGVTVRHAVSRGEWLLQIGRCYGVPYQSLTSANYVPNPDFIYPGQILTVPNIGSIGPITGPPCVVAYTVVTGDTWESLAQRYNTTVAILRRANPGALAVGRSIWVPRVP